ncbi:MAG: tyrosine-type recombinase/integrase [Pseudomonadota bacterium]
MAKQLLTDAKLKGIKANGKTQWLHDNTGLYVKVSPAGSMSFCTRYTINGVRRWLYHGAYPAMSLADAQKAHIETTGGAADCRIKQDPELDPAAKREAERKRRAEEKRQREQADLLSPTVASFVELYLTRYADKKKRSAPEDRRILEKDVVPVLGELKVKEVTRPNVVEVIDRIESREAFNQAWQTFRVMRRLFNFAIERGVIDANPCRGIKTTATYTPKNRVLGEVEIKRLLDFMYSPACGWSDAVKLLVEFQLTTAVRPGEARLMQWSEIDARAATWVIPPERLKTWNTKKNPQPHVVPLSARAVRLLERAKLLPTVAPAYVFPGIEKDKPLSEQAVGKAIARDLVAGGGLHEDGIVEPFTPHDLRRTAATHMAALGFGSVVPFVLGHTPQTVTGLHYDHHDYLAEKRRALDTWAQRLSGLKSGGAAMIVEITHRYPDGVELPKVGQIDITHHKLKR